MNKIIKEKIKQGTTLGIIIIAFVCTLAIMLKYENEGETKMPFNLEEMLVISSAEAETKTENSDNNKWNMNINQYNDVYLQFKKNNEYKGISYIKSISIENINITKPNQGKVYVYMPNSTEGKLFSYEDNFLVTTSLTYNGAENDNNKTLQISNQGGTLMFRVVNREVSDYVSNEDDEISYDGSLLKKTNVNNDDIKFNVGFDVVIRTDTNKYRGTITLDLPCGDVSNEGVSKLIEKDFSQVVFKRDNT